MITEALVQEVTESLYSAALRRVPPYTLHALEAAREREEQESARATLDLMVRSARLAEEKDTFEVRGNSIYQNLDEQAYQRLPQIMVKLAQRREAAEEQI